MTSDASATPARRNWYVLIAIGLAAGFLSGFFGVGGGTLIVPALVLILRYEQRLATGTSLAASDVAFVQVVGGGHVEPSLAHRYGGLYLSLVGPQSAAFESAELAWTFFRDKRRAP